MIDWEYRQRLQTANQITLEKTATNKFSFHMGIPGTASGYGDHIRACNEAGIVTGVGSVSSVGLGDIIACWEKDRAANKPLVPHVACVRPMSHNDVPVYGADIDWAVEEWLDRVIPHIGQDIIDWHELVITKHGNELDRNQIEWLADFYTALHPRLLERMGWQSHRICVFNFATGNPDLDQWELILPFLRLVGDNPDKFIIGLHEYSLDENDIWNRGLIGRFLKLFDICDEHGIPRPHVISHEWGWRDIKIPNSINQALIDIDKVNEVVAMYPEYLMGFIWTTQEWQDSDINLAVEKLIRPLTDMTLVKRYYCCDQGELPVRDEGKAREPYNREYWVVDPNRLSTAEIATIYKKAAGLLVTIGPSFDDGGIGSGLKHKKAVLWNIDGDEQQTFIDWYLTWYPSTAVEFRWHNDIVDPPDPEPPNALDVISYNQYDSRWGDELCGFGPKTLAQWGCLLTVYTDIADYWGIGNRDPLQENEYYKSRGGFSGHNLVSMAMSKVYPDVGNEGWLTWADHGQRMYTRLDEYLEAGIPCAARVDFDPATPQWEQHWVLITGKAPNGDYWMNNPWGGKKNVSVNDAYGKPGSESTILEVIFYFLDESSLPAVTTGQGVAASANDGIGLGYPVPITDMYAGSGATVAKFLSFHDPAMIGTIVSNIRETCNTYIIRAMAKWDGRNVTPQEFYDWTYPDTLRALNVLRGHGIDDKDVVIELHNEPNLKLEGLSINGSNGSWVDGYGCVNFFYEVWTKYKTTLPNVKYGIGGLSPGHAQANFRANSREFFLSMASHNNFAVFDVACLHCYTTSNWLGHSEVPEIEWAHTVTDKPIIITEASYHTPIDPNTGYRSVIDGIVYANKLYDLLTKLDLLPTLGVAWFVASASDPAFRHESFCISLNENTPYVDLYDRGIAARLAILRPPGEEGAL